jgi:hypothetical protein
MHGVAWPECTIAPVIEEPPDDGGEQDQEERPPEELVCRACGSEDIRRRKRAIGFAAVSVFAVAWAFAFDQAEAAFYFILAAAVFALIADRWVCDECGESWK